MTATKHPGKTAKKPSRAQSPRQNKPAAKATNTRERMLMHAAELFAARGFADVGLQEIVKTTGVTKGSLFWHFEGKRQIYVESVKQTLAAALDHSQHEINAATPAARLRQYLEWILPALSASPVARRLLLQLILDQDTELMKELMKGPMGESYAAFTKILKDLKPRHDKTALSFFVYAIFVLNDELLKLADVWEPKYRKRVGGSKSIQFIETLVKSW
jgi:AcrR family transcriptional regulator